ncbi:uncharacterized protein LOC129602059 [Paramacrobiotus metropolitanus]|uniref:uncharacterized protein LOC129602059 n=1 Tax=Paramacrobiotus metropolitanus TaxID=2943436 RepID=UPI00244594FC|nr:uncharacterized protein LOC129602059 [Paramacrobiotus metropolitanus]
MFRQLALFAWALCARIVVSLNCEELAAQCQEYERQEHLTVERLMSLSIPWPLTAEILLEYQPVDEAYCRYSNNTGHCVRDLLTRCPEFLEDDSSGWYGSELKIALARLCATSIAPVNYFRAVSHCRQHDPKLQQFLRRAEEATARDEVEEVPVNSHPVCGRVEYCQEGGVGRPYMNVNVARIEKFIGPASAQKAAYCGAEAVQTIRESAVQIYAAHCLNDSELDSDNVRVSYV